MYGLRHRFAFLVVGLVVGLVVVTWAQAKAQAPTPTVSFTETLDMLAKACGKDIDTHCAGVNLGNNRLKSCLIRNQASVTPACRETYGRAFTLIDKRAQVRNSVLKHCEADTKKLCAGAQKDDGAAIDCLLSAKRIGWRCSQALTEANFR